MAAQPQTAEAGAQPLPANPANGTIRRRGGRKAGAKTGAKKTAPAKTASVGSIQPTAARAAAMTARANNQPGIPSPLMVALFQKLPVASEKDAIIWLETAGAIFKADGILKGSVTITSAPTAAA
jgi:hypothetical protein